MSKQQKIVVGRLGAAYGIKGWLHITSFTEPEANIFNYTNWCVRVKNQWQPIQLETHKTHGNGYIIKLRDINDRELAMKHKGLEIGIDRTELPTPDQDEFYWSDLVGLTVVTTTGEKLGQVDYLFATGSNDVIVTTGEKQQFIPYIDHVIKHVDLNKQTITVDWEPI